MKTRTLSLFVLMMAVGCKERLSESATQAAGEESVRKGDRTLDIAVKYSDYSAGIENVDAVLEISKVKSDANGHTLMNPVVKVGEQKFFFRGGNDNLDVFDAICANFDPAFPSAAEGTEYGILEATLVGATNQQLVGSVAEDGKALSLYTLLTPRGDALKALHCGTKRSTSEF